jgi:hypothetical protein
MSLYQIQKRLVAPKNQFNAFGKYKYRSLEDICEAVKPLLAEYKYSLILTDEVVMVGNRYYVMATAKLYDESGNGIATNCAFARESETKKGMDESQITGAASSYARKYALNGLFCIDDTKDADGTNTHGKEEENATTKKQAPEKEKQEIIIEDLRLAVDSAKTEEDLTEMWSIYKDTINASSNKNDAVELFSERKKAIKESANAPV